MKKIFLSLLVCLFFVLSARADEISEYVKKSSFGSDSTFGIYILDSNSAKAKYKKNENKSLNPASVLKVLTFGLSYDVLGSDYIFETALYQDLNKDIYLKLGGDVLLSQKDLNELISNLKNLKYNKIYIDDSIFDKTPYPSSWLEEDKWPNQRAISPYIIDNNYVDVAINRSSLAKKVDIIQNDDYKISFINELKIGETQDITIERLYGDDSLIVNLKGFIDKDSILHLPVLRPEIYFNVRLNKALDKNKIIHNYVISSKKTPLNAKKIAFVGHNIEEVSKLILHNSDNFASEVVFKVAASKCYNNKEATFDDTINMFNKFYAPYLSKNDIIADASGVSRENKFCAKTIVNIIDKLLKNEKYKNLLATSNQGTLADRLLFLKDNFRAKTGTLRDYSSLVGYLKTRNNTDIIFVSIIQDSKIRKSLLQNFENTLIGLIYKNY